MAKATYNQTPEQIARDQIDRQLAAAGWVVQPNKAIDQSILKKAFSGQLVPQDPNDEPATILLERIKAEKAAQAQSTKPRKKPQRAKTPA